MKRVLRGIAMGVIVAAAAVAIAQDKKKPSAGEASLDWSRFRGPTGQGTSADKGLPTTWSARENVIWKTALPGPGSSSPIIVDERIYLTCWTGYNVPGKEPGEMESLKRHLLCLNRTDGKILWNVDVESALPEQDRMREGHGYASSTPVVDGERIYVFFGKSGVMAFDLDGKLQWKADVGSKLNGWGSAASPVLYGDLVIINASVESDSLVALDKRTGVTKWSVKRIRESWSTPLIATTEDGKPELMVSIMGKVLGIDPATGESLWSCATDIGSYMVPSLVAEDGIVYCIGGRSNGSLAVRMGGRGDVTKTHRLWTGKKGSNVSSPIYHDGHLYWMNDNMGIAYCAQAKTGDIVYQERLSGAGQVYAAPVMADGKLYYTTRNGRTFVLSAEPKFKQLAANDLSDRSTFNASPAIAGGRIFLRSDKFLYCIGK